LSKLPLPPSLAILKVNEIAEIFMTSCHVWVAVIPINAEKIESRFFHNFLRTYLGYYCSTLHLRLFTQSAITFSVSDRWKLLWENFEMAMNELMRVVWVKKISSVKLSYNVLLRHFTFAYPTTMTYHIWLLSDPNQHSNTSQRRFSQVILDIVRSFHRKIAMKKSCPISALLEFTRATIVVFSVISYLNRTKHSKIPHTPRSESCDPFYNCTHLIS